MARKSVQAVDSELQAHERECEVRYQSILAQLEKFEAIGGVSSIVPSEGIVFKYQGKTYKFTGAFAPVNQITGLVSF